MGGQVKVFIIYIATSNGKCSVGLFTFNSMGIFKPLK